jgi:hypothetical protein
LYFGKEVTIFTDQMPTYLVFKKVHCMMASGFTIVYRVVSQVLRMKMQNFKVALKRYLNTHSFYSVD